MKKIINGTWIFVVIILFLLVSIHIFTGIYNNYLTSKILKQQYDIEKTALENCDCG